MKRLVASLLVLLAGISSVMAEERKDGVSPSGKIGWHVVATAAGAEVLISEADQGESAAQKLGEVLSVSNTQVFVAPDDSWIIVQSGGGSVGVSLSAFSREKGMIYHQEKEMDIGAVALLAACGGDQKKADTMDHVYVRLNGWAKDSKSVLVEVGARGGAGKVDSFFAIYDLTEKKIGFDLEKFNRAGK